MSRCLLHKNDFEEFKQWCVKRGIEIRPGRGGYQLLQIKTPKSSWQAIYERLNAPEHLTVTWPLEQIVRRFLRDPIRKEN